MRKVRPSEGIENGSGGKIRDGQQSPRGRDLRGPAMHRSRRRKKEVREALCFLPCHSYLDLQGSILELKGHTLLGVGDEKKGKKKKGNKH